MTNRTRIAGVLAAGVLSFAVVGCAGAPAPPAAPPTMSPPLSTFTMPGAPTPVTPPATTEPSAAPSALPNVPGRAARGGAYTTVRRVIDGDTFETNTGQRVRVLGSDSCERNTPAGKRATAEARMLLEGKGVFLTREGDVDRDFYQRSLRYVRPAGGEDFGLTMVRADHTAVYEGRNDAGKQYLADLRAADTNGRDCTKE